MAVRISTWADVAREQDSTARLGLVGGRRNVPGSRLPKEAKGREEEKEGRDETVQLRLIHLRDTSQGTPEFFHTRKAPLSTLQIPSPWNGSLLVPVRPLRNLTFRLVGDDSRWEVRLPSTPAAAIRGGRG